MCLFGVRVERTLLCQCDGDLLVSVWSKCVRSESVRLWPEALSAVPRDLDA